MEKRVKINTFMVHLMCDKCDGGEMKPTGICLLSSPPKYPHECDKCGHEEIVKGYKYPRIDYEEDRPIF